MNIVMAFICVLTFTPALSAGTEVRDIGIGDNGFQFADTVLQRKFINALKRDGAVFQQREDGMVIYSSENEEKIKRVQKEILETSFTPSTHFEDEKVQNQLIKQFKTEGIRFSIEVKGGRNWVTWSEQDDSAVKKIHDKVLENAISDIIKGRKPHK